MKIKVILMTVVAAAALFVASCGKKDAACCEKTAISVDSLMAIAPEIVGDTIEVDGLCSHLCKHGGRKAFLVGTDSTIVLRCESTAEMGGAFAPDCIGKTLAVTGVVCENRIGEAEVAAMEARQAAADSASRAQEACAKEKKAQGQDSIDSFEARMADYRAKIAARSEAEGKNYLSFYYLEAISYSIPDKK